ncbi:protein kinase domain-containing protein [Limnoglobus roseus]|uniref:Serine/threonine-protein kinase PknB n=1 Tax=Limnoglobus roseus TaxID=2598579 RepID=A0A5C1ANX2_9BACT|nr:protein kinase [Limnoglobus roseus]QEL20871.1 serine/threonine-protein kinase PknB [Limnoglobus roseus]
MSGEVPGYPFLSPPQAADEIGRLGDYRILKKLGEGGMGFVFRGEDPALRRFVALKVMRPEVAAKPQAADRFLREGRSAAALKSDHIITIYQVGQANGVPFLAMEFLEGLPLDVWLRGHKKAVPLPHAVRVVRDALRGLAAAHDKGLVHRDIKPANLWIEKGTARTKVLDFGLTRGNAGDDQLTQEGAVIGTPAYMAPEQAAGKSVDPRADLFSVGVVFYHLLAGKNPFARGNLMETLAAIGFETQLPVIDHRADVPKAYSDFLDRLLAKNPDGRPANAKAALQELTAIEKGLADANKTAPTSSPAIAVLATDAAPQVWGDLTADEGVQVHTTRLEKPHPIGPRPTTNKKLRLGGGALAALLLVAGLAFVLAKKGQPKVDPPKDDKPVAKAEPKKAEPKKSAVVAHPNRTAAEYVLNRNGGVVTTAEPGRIIANVADLPAGPFDLTQVKLLSETTTDADLDVLRPLASVEWIEVCGPGITDAGLAKLAGFPFAGKVHFLRVYLCDGVTDEGFRSVAKFPALTHLVLSSKNVTGAGLAHLPGPNFMNVDLQCPRLADVGLAHLKALPRLMHLGLDNDPITDAGLAHVAAVKRLDSLSIHGCQKITDAGIKHLEGMERLAALSANCRLLTPAAVASLAKIKGMKFLAAYPPGPDYPHLTDADLTLLGEAQAMEDLYVDLSAVTDAGLEALARIKTLKALNLKGSKATAAGVKKLRAALPACKIESDFAIPDADRTAAEFVLNRGGTVVTNHNPYLEIGQIKNLPPAPFGLLQIALKEEGFCDADLDAFRALGSLTVVDIHHSAITDAGVEKLAGFPFAPKVTALFLRSSADGVFRAAAKFPALTHLAMGGSKGITGAGLAHLAGTGVEYLNLDGCPQLADAEMVHLKGMAKLRQVMFIFPPITDAGLKHIAAVQRLDSLQLVGGTNVTDAGIKHLEGMAFLGALEVSCPGFTPAVLQCVPKIKGLTAVVAVPNFPWRSPVTDADLKPLADAKALERFDLRPSAVTDTGLETLAQVKTLKELNLKGSKATAAGVRKLRAALPDCKVTSDFDAK